MTTSMTDARFTSIHFTPQHLLALDFDEPAETGWGVMPGFDESLTIPLHLEPPRLDADETLPSALHPSYPFGRPPSKSKPVSRTNVGNLLGTIREAGDKAGTGAVGEDHGMVGRERWAEMGMEHAMEQQHRREVPPGMAGAKRPPSPPSPALRPHQLPQPRSVHLQHLYARQREATPAAPADPFDAPVPNETYTGADEGEDGGDGMEGVEEEGEDGENGDEE